MSYYFLIDILRSLQSWSPLSFQPFDLHIHLSNGEPLSSVYRDLITETQLITCPLASEDVLLLILAILSEILTFHQWLGPMVSPVSRFQPDSPVSQATHSERDLHLLAHESHGRVYHNSRPSFSVGTEYQRISTSLGSALDKLETTLPQAPPKQWHAYRNLDTLLYFNRLILSGGSQVLSLLTLVNYSAEGGFRAPGVIPDEALPRFDSVCLHNALCILESVDLDGSETSENYSAWPPVWCPLVLFYAGIVIWTSLRDPSRFKPTSLRPCYPKTLKMVEFEMRKMKWPDAAVMADILQHLRFSLTT